MFGFWSGVALALGLGLGTVSAAGDAPNCLEGLNGLAIRVARDTHSSGWAYKLEDESFELPAPGCLIRWNVVTLKNSPEHVSINSREKCALSLTDRSKYQKAVLCTILQKYPREKIRSFQSGDYFREPAFREGMARASASSLEYAKLRDARNQGRFEDPNALFVKLFNAAGVAGGLGQVFKAHGLGLELSAVEKVFEEKAHELEFSRRIPELKALGRKRVMTGAGMMYFRLTPH
jgi:hypothetical protein